MDRNKINIMSVDSKTIVFISSETPDEVNVVQLGKNNKNGYIFLVSVRIYTMFDKKEKIKYSHSHRSFY